MKDKNEKLLAMTITEGSVQFEQITDELDTYYNIIKCQCIDIVSRQINGEWYEVVCDDEGLFCPEPIVTAVSAEGKPELVGGLVILRYGGEGKLTGLEPEDVLRLSNAVQYSIQKDKLQPVIVLR